MASQVLGLAIVHLHQLRRHHLNHKFPKVKEHDAIKNSAQSSVQWYQRLVVERFEQRIRPNEQQSIQQSLSNGGYVAVMCPRTNLSKYVSSSHSWYELETKINRD